jgi:hypothetical protein
MKHHWQIVDHTRHNLKSKPLYLASTASSLPSI